jgi:hypothetical protein
MRLEFVSSGASAEQNEDWVGSFQSPGQVDLVVIDGGTSVADRNYVDPDHGDVVWFVSRFAAALGRCIKAGLGQQAGVHAAVEAVFGEFTDLTAGQAVPQYAWPIAALSWVRLRDTVGGRSLSLYSLGDCKVLTRDREGVVRDLDPWINPQEAVLRAEITRLQAEGVLDAAQRHARLLPILRARREHQNTAANPSILCLRPNGAFAGRSHESLLEPGAAVLAMTDGFYRLVDTYGLHTNASLFAACMDSSVRHLLDTLRGHEAGAREAALAVKRADDASAILWQGEAA